MGDNETPSCLDQSIHFLNQCGLLEEVGVGVIDDHGIEALAFIERERVRGTKLHRRFVAELFPRALDHLLRHVDRHDLSRLGRKVEGDHHARATPQIEHRVARLQIDEREHRPLHAAFT